MTELLLLLLPVAAASGWYAARRSFRRGGEARLTGQYPSTLNDLLADQSETTLETFLELLRSEGDEVEIHLLLGGLFRRRGEVDRAIRVHQNLIARPALDAAQRSRALLELGEDYMKAGLLDRAESIFSDLVSRNALVVPALRGLIDIYQRENEWDAAIRVAQHLQRRNRQDQRRFIAHCYCELAEQARQRRDVRQVEEMLTRARRSDPQCGRISLIAGQLALERRDFREAIRQFQQVAKLDPTLIPETLEPLIQSYRELADAQGLTRYLEALQREHPEQEAIVVAVARLRSDADDTAGARRVLIDFLSKQPSVGAMTELVALSPEEEVKGLREPLEQMRQQLPDYRCAQCGFTGNRLHWQCPGCRSWDTVRPLTLYECGT